VTQTVQLNSEQPDRIISTPIYSCPAIRDVVLSAVLSSTLKQLTLCYAILCYDVI